MPLLTLGLNHKTAPIALRERLALPPEQLPATLQEVLTLPAVNEAAIISTCNRTELYCKLAAPEAPLLEWLLTKNGLNTGEHQQFFYQHFDQDSVTHLLRVACGLDSMVLGEPQILGQLKQAYRQAEQAGALGIELNRLFQQAFAVAKYIRSATAIGEYPVSVAYTAVHLARQIFTSLAEQSVLLVGAGDTINLVAQHFRDQGVKQLWVANRTFERAAAVAKPLGATPVKLSELAKYLPQSDIVVSSTASQLPLIGKGMVESALKQRKRAPIFMLDLAVPRDIEAEVAQLADIYLYNIDDLQQVINQNQQSRRQAAEQAEILITSKTLEFLTWQQSREAVPAIRHYREQAEMIAAQTLAEAKTGMANGKTADEALELLTHRLTRRLLHVTTARLDEAAREQRHDILRAADYLLKPYPTKSD